jgi:hypothetical protein
MGPAAASMEPLQAWDRTSTRAPAWGGKAILWVCKQRVRGANLPGDRADSRESACEAFFL